MNRREVLQVFGAALLSGCAEHGAAIGEEPGRLNARPHSPTRSGKIGTLPLNMGGDRDGFLHVPRAGTMPLAVLLHGAGGASKRVVERYRDIADELGFIILVPDSRGMTWDRIRGDFGEDVSFIDRALSRVFDEYSIDPRRVAVGGFSDGASYALSLGIMNGDLFTHVLAFSPGFAAPTSRHGSPRFFISHGTEDEILPIARTSRRLVPVLRDAGFDVDYEEFRGPHTVPPEIARHGFSWFVGPSSRSAHVRM